MNKVFVVNSEEVFVCNDFHTSTVPSWRPYPRWMYDVWMQCSEIVNVTIAGPPLNPELVLIKEETDEAS